MIKKFNFSIFINDKKTNMKKLFAIILPLLSLFNCSTQSINPIVDYKTNYDDNRGIIDIAYSNEKMNQQTIVLIRNKEYSLKDFKKLVSKNKAQIEKITTDSLEIKNLNYSDRGIKTIIFASKK